jgi:hypothetical protein
MEMKLEITPQPSDQERAAIEAALAEETPEDQVSPWADALLPERDEGFEA